jgi:hypothetical protein
MYCVYVVCVCILFVCCVVVCMSTKRGGGTGFFFVSVKKLFSRTSLFSSLSHHLFYAYFCVLCVECEFVCILYKYILCVGLLGVLLLLLCGCAV